MGRIGYALPDMKYQSFTHNSANWPCTSEKLDKMWGWDLSEKVCFLEHRVVDYTLDKEHRNALWINDYTGELCSFPLEKRQQ
jgi:hypothetical protein